MKIKVAMATALITALAMILPACGDAEQTAEIADVTVSNINTESLVPETDYGTASFNFRTEAGDDFACVVTGIGSKHP